MLKCGAVPIPRTDEEQKEKERSSLCGASKVAKVGSGRGSNLLKYDRRRRLTKRSSLSTKRSPPRGRTKVAKVGPLRARVKSAKVRAPPYVYYPPARKGLSGSRRGGQTDGVLVQRWVGSAGPGRSPGRFFNGFWANFKQNWHTTRPTAPRWKALIETCQKNDTKGDECYAG